MFKQGIQSYRRVNVNTSSSVQLIVMCYEGAIDSLKLAKQRYKENDFEGKAKAIKRFMDIIAELQCALDFEKGAGVAKNLDAVYNFITHKILEADMKKDFAAIDSVIDILSDLLTAWEVLLKKGDDPMPMNVQGYNHCDLPKKHGYISA
jgi:flagellar secretion chaperone FliS